MNNPQDSSRTDGAATHAAGGPVSPLGSPAAQTLLDDYANSLREIRLRWSIDYTDSLGYPRASVNYQGLAQDIARLHVGLGAALEVAA